MNGKWKRKNSFILSVITAITVCVLSSCSSRNTELNPEIGSPVSNKRKAEKPRLLILTDIGGDPDDQQSLIRLLVYANEFDIEGIVTERWKKHSGSDQIALVRNILNAYGKVRDNLLKHADGYPSAEYLKNIVKQGAVDVVGRTTGDWMEYIGEGKDTEGSRHIVSVLEKEDPRPVDIAVWGGAADLAQALFWLRTNRTANELASIISGIRVHTIDHQDSTGPWIESNFPDLFLIYDFSPSGNRFKSVYRGMYMGGDEALTSLHWINTHIRNDHGPLGAAYPPKTSTQDNPHGAMKEGDTPSWFYFYKNGLNDPARPEYGGWGGRFKDMEKYFNDAEDKVGDTISAHATVWRWRPHFQNDFQARMDWCVKPYEEANHNPVAFFNGSPGPDIVYLNVSPGDPVQLSANASFDPDGDELSYHWFHYPEPGTYEEEITITDSHTANARFTVPAVDGSGTIHIILTVKDNGVPDLYSYRRIIINVDDEGENE
jgi:hypothetical protein